MKNLVMSKMAWSLVVALSVVAVGQNASAAPITYAQWASGTDVVVGDKDFHFVSDTGNIDNAPGVTATFVFGSLASGEFGLNVLFVGGLEPAANTAFNGSFNYTVTITDPTKFFTSVQLDTTHGGTQVEVWKSEASALFTTLHSIDGSTDMAGIAGNVQFLNVTDTIQITAQPQPGALTSITNSFTQAQVPEIDANVFATALTLLLGCVAVMFGRKKVAAPAAV